MKNIVLSFVLGLLSAGVAPAALGERVTTYYHTDALGSVVAASNASGALLWRKEYAPYGEQIDSTAENEKIAYTGKEHDDITGLMYYGARYYDPQLGRFISPDPLNFVEDNPMSFNRYAQQWTGEETKGEIAKHVATELYNPGHDSNLYAITADAWRWFNEKKLPEGDLFKRSSD